MKRNLIVGFSLISTGAIAVQLARGAGRDDGGIALHSCDVILADLTGPANWNTGTGPTDGIVRYSIGTLACNVGHEPLDWHAETIDHPFMPQNLFRLKNGRFEQIGVGWLKHAFLALQQSFCGSCTSACGGGACDELGVGCSDPYTASRNGGPSGLGPRSQVNAAKGEIMVWPYTRPASQSQFSNNNGQIHVRVADVDPAQNAGAVFVAEAAYMVREESQAGNDDNNTSYRRVSVGTGQGFPLAYIAPTVRLDPAIKAWRAIDPQVQILDIDIPDDGRMVMGWRVTDNGNGTWHYEYAIYNMNSDRSGGSFSVPIPDCVEITNIGFHDAEYHSGEPYVGLDWTVTRANGSLTWATTPFAQDVNANALRWATLYNFRFDATTPPEETQTVIGLFKPGTPSDLPITAFGPQAGGSPACPADIAPRNGDSIVNVADLLAVIGTWGTDGAGDIHPICGDSTVNVQDLLAVIGAWGPCPK